MKAEASSLAAVAAEGEVVVAAEVVGVAAEESKMEWAPCFGDAERGPLTADSVVTECWWLATVWAAQIGKAFAELVSAREEQ